MRYLFIIVSFLLLSCSHSEKTKEGISKKQVTAVLHKHRREFKLCYNSWIKKKSKEDVVEYQWQIRPDGTVNWAKVKSTQMQNADNFNICVIQIFKRMKFPRSKTGAFTLPALPIDFYHL